MAQPGTGSTNQTFTVIAAKKLAGKAHTSNQREIYEEAIQSNIQLSTRTVFAEPIPQTVTRTLYGRFSASAGQPYTAEFVEFYIDTIGGTTYLGTSGSFGQVGFGGGDETQSSGPHGYRLFLTSSYESLSSGSWAGTGSFVNNKEINTTNGGLQLIGPSMGPQTSNLYDLQLWTAHPDSGGTEIGITDAIDWQIDYFAGTIFVQDYKASKVPGYARGFIYVGKYADEMITEASSSGGGGGSLSNIVEDTTPQLGGNLDVNGNDIVSVSDGNINLLPHGAGKVIMDGNGSSGGVTISDGTIDIRNGGSVSEIKMYCEVGNAHYVRFAAPPHAQYSGNPDFVLPPTEGSSGQVLKTDGSGNTSWTSVLAYGRTAVTSHVTASISNRILGVSASAALDIRLPAASDYTSGQFFTIKDEAGNADTYNITVRVAEGGSDKIDGVSNIILESPYAAVNLYSNGSDKFFIY